MICHRGKIICFDWLKLNSIFHGSKTQSYILNSWNYRMIMQNRNSKKILVRLLNPIRLDALKFTYIDVLVDSLS